MIEFEHSKNPAERMKYQSFLRMAIERVKNNIYSLENPKLDFPHNSELSRKISVLINETTRQDNEYLLDKERKYLKILENKYKNYQTHPQKPYSCQICGEIECVCDLIDEDKRFSNETQKLF